MAAAAVELQLSSLCELLGLAAAAVDWLQLAAPEKWPSAEQLQQAEQSNAVQQLALDILQAHTVSATASASAAGTRPQSAVSTSTSIQPESWKVQEDAAFLREAVQGIEPATLWAWLHGSPAGNAANDPAADNSLGVGSGDGTWGSRVGSAQGGRRPGSSAGARASAAAAALSAAATSSGTGNSSNKRVQLLQVKPLTDLDSWVSIARYLVDHAQYTAGQKLCTVALERAR